MKTISVERDEVGKVPADGRWIRPAKAKRIGGALAAVPGRTEESAPHERTVERWTTLLLAETRARVSELTTLERQLEDRIRRRWEESAAEIERREATFHRDLARMRSEAEKEIEDRRAHAEKEGRSEGFSEGFARGREEGYRLGLEEGRCEGLQVGQREGQEQGARQISDELSKAAASMAQAARDLSRDRGRILQEARSHVVGIAMQVARRVVKRELAVSGDVTLRAVAAAVELIFRRGTLVVQVHPGDAPFIEDALRAEPRWAEGFEAVEVHASSGVTRGGCRLVSGAGTVDMTIETQLELLERALEEAVHRPETTPQETTPAVRCEATGRRAQTSGGEPT